MKQSLQLKLAQQLRLTPQLQQAIRFLQLSAVELEHELQSALESNPLLEVVQQNTSVEIEDPVNDSDYERANDSDALEPIALNQDRVNDDSVTESLWSDDSAYSYKQTKSLPSSHNDFLLDSNTHTETLQEHLQWQLNLTDLNSHDRLMATYIIDAVEPNGRLAMAPLEIFESIAELEQESIEFDEFEAVRHLIQQFNPIGCACIDLQECLRAQISLREHPKKLCTALHQLLHQHLNVLHLHDLNKISRLTHIHLPLLKQCLEIIRALHPYPGELISNSRPDFIVPDVIAYRDNNKWKVRLNAEHISELGLNQQYVDLLNRDKTTHGDYLKQYLNDARNIIQSLNNRNQTLFKVCSIIVNIQKDFFDRGASAMKPLTQQSVAQRIGVHESTISRITTQKYMHTPQGIVELKYFFSSQLGNSDNSHSATAIQSLIKSLIQQENSQKPMSDTKIKQWLHENKGINIARRTVAKYRELMSIPSSSDRKKFG